MTLGKKICREGSNVCMYYEFNLLHHVCVVAKRLHAAAHEGDNNTPSGPTGRGPHWAQRAKGLNQFKKYKKTPCQIARPLLWKLNMGFKVGIYSEKFQLDQIQSGQLFYYEAARTHRK